MSIRRRFVAITVVGLVLVIGLVTIAAYLVARSSLEDQLNRDLRQQFDQIARSVRHGTDYVVTGPCQFQAAPACARVVTSKGRTVTVDGITSTIPIPPGTDAVASGEAAAFVHDTVFDGQPMRVYVAQLRPGEALLVAESSADLRTDLRDLEIALAVVGGLGLILLAGVTAVVTRANLAPIRALVEATRRIAHERDSTLRVDQRGHDELSVLASSFNAMLEQLDAVLAARRHFVADASHELRTPLTSLKTNVDLLRRDELLTPAQRQATIDALDAQARDLVTLVNGLIDLARGEEADAQREPMRLDDLVARCVRRAETQWPGTNFHVDLDPFVIDAAPARLAAAVSSVLDNAAKFAGGAGPVTVTLKHGTLSITDMGPGIAPQDRQRVFDRFYRAPAGRALPGSGLGLAIARDVTTAHGGTITAQAGPNGRGTTISLQFGDTGPE